MHFETTTKNKIIKPSQAKLSTPTTKATAHAITQKAKEKSKHNE